MSTRLFQRCLSLALSAVLTVVVMGGIDQLSLHQAAPALWAEQGSARA